MKKLQIIAVWLLQVSFMGQVHRPCFSPFPEHAKCTHVHTYIFRCLLSFSHLYESAAAQPLLVTVVDDVAVTVLFGGHTQLCLRITPSTVLGGAGYQACVGYVQSKCPCSGVWAMALAL